MSQIIQDNLGYIWFGTQYGLDRYDGYKFKVFVHDPRNPSSLGGDFISSLFKDHRGYLWVGCAQTLDRFDPTTETFTHYRVDADDPDGLAGTVVNISEDRRGVMWLATGTGLHRLDPSTGKVIHYRHHQGDLTSLSSNDVKSSGEDAEGTFWVGTGEGLDAFDRETGKVKSHVSLPDPVQISFFEDHLGVFWIVHASGNGLAVLDRKTNKLSQYSFYSQDPSDSALTGVMGILEDREGNLWLGSPGAGLLKLDRKNNRFVRYRNNPADPQSLAEDKVIALFQDREGNIWTGLHSMGPNHFALTPQLFETFQAQPSNPKGLDMTFINAMYEPRPGILWIGNDSGLHRLDRKTGQYTHWSSGLGVKPMIITITEDHSGVLWVGTYGHGLARFDQETGQFKVYKHIHDDPSSLSNDQVHRLFVDHAGTLWAATDDGLNRFDPATGGFKVYKLDWQNRRSQSYVAVAEDQSGTLWLGTHYSGLHHFDPQTGRFTVYKSQPNIPGTLLDNMVPTVHIDSAGSIWVGTEAGLDKLDPATGKFTAFLEPQGSPGNTVTCILEDDSGKLWMSSNVGILCRDPQTGVFRHYTADDGLPGNDFTGWGTGFKSPSGELFFGGFAGGIAFRPEKLVDSDYVPPIVLTDFHSAYQPMKRDDEMSGTKSISYAESVSLRQRQNSFSIEFSALSFFNPSGNRYRYKLEGLDQDWNETGSDQRQANYTTLPIGSYKFRVQGATTRGPWSEPGASLQIEILPAWWQTWWFHVAVGLAVAAMALGVYRTRVRNIRERAREFRKLADNSPDMIMRFDPALRYKYVNPIFSEYMGRTQDAFLGKTTEELGLLGNVSAFDAGLRNVFKTCIAATHQFTLERAGVSRQFESRFIPELGERGRIKSVLMIVRDITEHEEMLEKLRQSEFYLREGERLARLASWSLKTDRTFHYWSPEGYFGFGFDPTKGVPTLDKMLTTVHPDDHNLINGTYARMVAEGVGCDITYRVFHPERGVRIMRSIGEAVFADGRVARFVGNTLDITERETLTRELRRREAYLAEAQKLSHTGSFGWKPDTDEHFWSDETFRIWEYDKSTKITLQLVLDLIHPEDKPLIQEVLAHAAGGRDFDAEYRLQFPNGAVKHLHIAAHGVRDDSGCLEFFGAVTDVSESKRAEEAVRRGEADLRKAQAELAHAARVTTVGELAASIAHEVNQPIAALVTNANACLRWLERDSPNLQEACDAVRRIIRDGNRGSEVISRIRSLLKKEESCKRRLNVNELIHDIIAMVEPNLQSTALQLNLSAELPFISGDQVQLQQVLLNLIMNAIDAMKQVAGRPRVLRIGTEVHKEREVLVAVEDTGVGLDPKAMENLFEAFYTTKPEGLGLGLSISRSVVESHGGRLWVEANQGFGVTFRFTLPVEGGGPA